MGTDMSERFAKRSENPDCIGCLPSRFAKRHGFSPARPRTKGRLPYCRKHFLLTKGERAFYVSLKQAVGQDYLLFAKVRLADLLFVPSAATKRQSLFNRIQAKHVDFLLCDPHVVRPLLAIELDDASHEEEDRRERDEFVDQALKTAGLPILRVPAKCSYDAAALREQIRQSIRYQPTRTSTSR